GRGRRITPSPVKEFAVQHGLPCLQPEKLKDAAFVYKIKEIKPDLIVTAAYGKILPPKILSLPRCGCVNIHASLLPLFRGAAPIQRSIMAGARETGVTIYLMDEGMDTGPVIIQKRTTIAEGETCGELTQKLSFLGSEALLEALDMLKNEGNWRTVPQDEAKATYAPPIKAEEELLDWEKRGREIANCINGLSPVPGAYTFFKGRRMKILRAKTCSLEGAPGRVIKVSRDDFVVGARERSVLILEVQPAGKKKISAGDFIRGYALSPGERLGLNSQEEA
ncbi:MAG TPA: methionyl-tRNA formyltransferase, partial [Firmicutes bacterium]|nr:methionyl-tRNA formyltransferase [Bacillota bacterium]